MDETTDADDTGVTPLGRRGVAALEARARREGRRWMHADCAAADDKAGVMAALARGFGLPAHFGANLDALYDCMTDLEAAAGARGFTIVVEHLPTGPSFDDPQREALLEVFSDAAAYHAGRGTPFALYWSLGRGGRSARR